MKIAIYHNLPSGGAKRAVFEICRHLKRRGHSLHEFTFPSADLSYLPLYKVVDNTTVAELKWKPCANRRIPMLTPYLNTVIGLMNLRHLTNESKKLARLIDAGNFDIVFAHDCRFTLNPFLLRYVSTPSVFYCHHGTWRSMEVDPDAKRSLLARGKDLYYWPSRWIYATVERRIECTNIRMARRVLTNSKFAQSRIYQAYRVTSEVVYLGVDTEKFRPLVVPKGDYVLAVGAVTYQKGYRFLIKAMAQIPSQVRPPLIIAANSADAAERALIEHLAAKHGVQLDIRRVKHDDEMVQLYSGAQVFVFTAINEPFGLAVLEAMACGTPVVAVREGGPRELILHGETGLLVQRDPALFAEAMCRLLCDEELRQRMGQNGLEYVRSQWTWNQAADQLERHLYAVAGLPE